MDQGKISLKYLHFLNMTIDVFEKKIKEMDQSSFSSEVHKKSLKDLKVIRDCYIETHDEA